MIYLYYTIAWRRLVGGWEVYAYQDRKTDFGVARLCGKDLQKTIELIKESVSLRGASDTSDSIIRRKVEEKRSQLMAKVREEVDAYADSLWGVDKEGNEDA